MSLIFGSPEANAHRAAHPLVACPFCGPGAFLVEVVDLDRGHFYVQCNTCGATGPRTGNDQLARQAWNHRELQP